MNTKMFQVEKKIKSARRGILKTEHGDIQTPFFMPIATKGAVKSLSSQDMLNLEAQIILSNTYHLMLRPGMDDMRQLGGLHEFMNWQGPILTDSGGYQVFSLGNIRSTDDEGVTFQSHIDGKKIRLTPEGSMAMQESIGADIIMQFDDVAAGNSSYQRYEEAMVRSLNWARRCKNSYHKKQKLFGIIQGGVYEDLRKRSMEGLMDINFDGYAIGGLSVGENREDAFRIVQYLCSEMPEDKPRYFMGGGMPEEMMFYITCGVDMFDCVLPTRNARHGSLFTWKGNPAECIKQAFDRAMNGGSDKDIKECLYEPIQITRATFTFDKNPIDPFSEQETSRVYTKAYLRHLFKTKELLAYRLATLQNLGFYLRFMKEVRNLKSSL